MIETDQQVLVRALDAAANPVLITERTGCIVWINKALGLLSGYSKPELVGKTPHLLSSGRQSTTFYRDLWMTILAGLTWINPARWRPWATNWSPRSISPL